MTSSALWQRIRSARSAAGLRQQDVAEACGVTRVAVGHWESPDENRRTTPSAKHLRTLSDLTGAPLEWLISDESEIHPTWMSGLEDAQALANGVEWVMVPLFDDGLACMHDLIELVRDGVPCSEAAKQAKCTGFNWIPLSKDYADSHGVVISHTLVGFHMDDRAMEPSVMKGDSVFFQVGGAAHHNDIVAVRTIDARHAFSLRRLIVKHVDGEKISLSLEPMNDDNLTISLNDLPLVNGSISQTLAAETSRTFEYLGPVYMVSRVIV